MNIMKPCYLGLGLVFIILNSTTRAAETDALAILANIQARHLPYGTILDPIFVSSTSDQIKGYTRCGDSALWTGAYLAAESFRYQTTKASDALTNIASTVQSIQALI